MTMTAISEVVTGSVATGVVLGDVTYGFSCALPREDDLGPVVGTPGSELPASLRLAWVAGEDPAEVIVLIAAGPLDLEISMVALGQPDTCTQPTTRVRSHTAGPGLSDRPTTQDETDTWCARSRLYPTTCAATGRPFQHLDPSVDGTEGDENRSIWLEGAVAATNTVLSEGGGPRERLDPLDLAEQDHDYVQRTALRNDEVLYRVGIRVVEQGPGRVVLEVLHQSGDEMGRVSCTGHSGNSSRMSNSRRTRMVGDPVHRPGVHQRQPFSPGPTVARRWTAPGTDAANSCAVET